MYIPELIIKHGRRRRLSPRTIQTYSECLRTFFSCCDKDPKRVTRKDVEDYLDRLVSKGRSGSTVNVHMNALKFLFEEILRRNLFVRMKFSRKPVRLVEGLSESEVLRLLDAIPNKKHKLMISLMYAAGLRVSELLNLKVKDLDIPNSYGYVRGGKGNKDRLFVIAKGLKTELSLHLYDGSLHHDSYLFTSQLRKQYSRETIRRILYKASRKARLGKKVHPHMLRHSFATHTINNGYDVMSLQSLLGHASSQTTMGYVHSVSTKMINVVSPYDLLKVEKGMKRNEESLAESMVWVR